MPTPLEPRVTPPVVLGLDFGGSKMAAAVIDPSGVRLGHVVTPVAPADNAERTFARGIAAAQQLLADVAPGRELSAVGACTFGIPHDDRVELAPNIDGWEALPFGTRLRGAFPGTRVEFATDVKAAARAELADGALVGCDIGLYVNLGTGLAAALVVHGEVVSGAHGAAGEIGYNIRASGMTARDRRLEDAVSGKALRTAGTRLLGRGDVGALFNSVGTDAQASKLVADFVAELTVHLVNLTIALDPERVVVGGGMTRAWAHLRPPIADALADAVPFPPDLTLAAHPYDAPLLGALALGRSARPVLSTVPDAVSEGAPA